MKLYNYLIGVVNLFLVQLAVASPVLEWQQVSAGKVELIDLNVLRISGSPHSSIDCIESVKVEKNKDVLTIKALLSKSSTVEFFDERIQLSEDIRSVTFGNKNVELWSLKNGINKDVIYVSVDALSPPVTLREFEQIKSKESGL